MTLIPSLLALHALMIFFKFKVTRSILRYTAVSYFQVQAAGDRHERGLVPTGVGGLLCMYKYPEVS